MPAESACIKVLALSKLKVLPSWHLAKPLHHARFVAKGVGQRQSLSQLALTDRREEEES